MTMPSSKKIADQNAKAQARNIEIGEAIICGHYDQKLKKFGWVLPGGKFTVCRKTAHEMAYRINRQLMLNKRKVKEC